LLTLCLCRLLGPHSDEELLNQLCFYGAYHSKKWNQIIHIIFVPMILWASFVWGSATGPLVALPKLSFLPAFVADNLTANFSFFAMLYYVSYYIYLGDYPVAVPYSAFIVGLFLHAMSYARAHGAAAHWHALAAQALGWYVQVAIGHNVIEKRKPALLDSLFDAIVMAPLFTFYEVIFALGFRSEFKKRLDTRVGLKIVELNKAQRAKQDATSAATAAAAAAAGAKRA